MQMLFRCRESLKVVVLQNDNLQQRHAQEHFYPSNMERGTFKVLHVSYHLGKKNKQQEMSTTAVCSSWKAEETVFSTRLLQTFSLGFFS